MTHIPPENAANPRRPARPSSNLDQAWLESVRWDADGLVPAIAQEVGSQRILMVAWMNRDALAETAATGQRGLLVAFARPSLAQGRGVRSFPENQAPSAPTATAMCCC
jgi:hypothetical protein